MRHDLTRFSHLIRPTIKWSSFNEFDALSSLRTLHNFRIFEPFFRLFSAMEVLLMGSIVERLVNSISAVDKCISKESIALGRVTRESP